jgi:D-alanyl-D-alanine carboxypeptidase
MMASRACRVSAFAFGLLVAGGALAAAPALVVDADSGKVLYAERATDPWFPASITKLMTAYVALQAVREGKVALDTPLAVSASAAAQPPSKMAFKPGQEITLDNALKIIMVKSANDVSVTIAEGVGGSVEGFADLMNQTAQRLGMRESRFVNPHGLPDERQQTSARDMAILARALYRDFPERQDLFQIGAIRFGRRIMNNHNGLIGRYPGADGMKTGFICSSGFNVVASATRNGRRLITVVMGSPNATERTLKAVDLFDYGFSSVGWSAQKVEDLPPSASLTPPDLRPYICGRRGPVPSEEDAQVSAAGAVQANASGNTDNALASLFSPPTLASAPASGSAPAPKRTLGPRAYFEPIPVWIGRTPPSALATAEPAEKSAKAKKTSKVAAKPTVKPLARSGKTDGAVPAAATAFSAAGAPPIVDDGKPKGAIRPKPATGGDKPKAGAIQAKPKPVAAAVAPDAKPAAKKPETRKPEVKTPAAKASAKPAADKPKATAQAKPAKAKPDAKNKN